MTDAGEAERPSPDASRSAGHPILPRHALGYVYEKGNSTVILWQDDRTHEAAPDGQATPEALQAFGDLVALALEAGFPNMARLHDLLQLAGWRDVGLYMFRWQAGALYQHALTQARLAAEAYAERIAFLDAYEGRHPPLNSSDWPAWADCSERWNATARGARVLAVAAIEALVNEILVVMQPEEYADWEERKRLPTLAKLDRLIKLHEFDPEPEWMNDFREQNALRRALVHHKPEWRLDTRAADSVEPNPTLSPEGIGETLAALDRVIEGLFALYDSDVPVTMRRGWYEAVLASGL